MKNLFVLLLSLAAFLIAQILPAQDRFSFELRPAVSFTTQDLGEVNLETGLGFEGVFEYRFVTDFSVYVGWGWNHFSADDSYAGSTTDYEETGYVFGLQYSLPFGDSPFALNLRGGSIFNHLEAENEEGEIIYDTGHGIGWQAGVGVDISLGTGWLLRPGAKYQSISRDMEFGTSTTPVDLTYISAGVGILKRF